MPWMTLFVEFKSSRITQNVAYLSTRMNVGIAMAWSGFLKIFVQISPFGIHTVDKVNFFLARA